MNLKKNKKQSKHMGLYKKNSGLHVSTFLNIFLWKEKANKMSSSTTEKKLSSWLESNNCCGSWKINELFLA